MYYEQCGYLKPAFKLIQKMKSNTEEITIRVAPEAANAYRSASEENRHKMDVLLSLRLTDATQSEGSLQELMHEIGRKAQERGLTPEILQSILEE